jgi:ATP-dependent Clp protease ATP-binding subunit ClpC
MFERFTDRSRRVLVLAQEEARELNHAFIGTEHILLGLMREGEGVAARVLHQVGLRFDHVFQMIEETVGSSTNPSPGSPPFTPRAKKVLELSLREALQLGHSYIGTEHMLLGLLREGDGVAAEIMVSANLNLSEVRSLTLQMMGEPDVDRSAADPVVQPSEVLMYQVVRRMGDHRRSDLDQLAYDSRATQIAQEAIELVRRLWDDEVPES